MRIRRVLSHHPTERIMLIELLDSPQQAACILSISEIGTTQVTQQFLPECEVDADVCGVYPSVEVVEQC